MGERFSHLLGPKTTRRYLGLTEAVLLPGREEEEADCMRQYDRRTGCPAVLRSLPHEVRFRRWYPSPFSRGAYVLGCEAGVASTGCRESSIGGLSKFLYHRC